MADRRPLVGGNWKMNTDLAAATALAGDVVAGCAGLTDRCDVVVFPPFPYLQRVGEVLGATGVILGAQDLFWTVNGAYTGEVSAEMLIDLGVRTVLAGHSERRHVIGEDDQMVNAKLRHALGAGLQAVLCIGETLEQRQAGRTEEVNLSQLANGLGDISSDLAARLSIAYEPVWAIGTGEVATPADAAAVHDLIRSSVADHLGDDVAGSIRIQYGGSVKATNAADLFAQPEIDGALVGGASLEAEQFVNIVRAAVEAHAHSI